MTRNQAEDIRWVAVEVANLAVLLRSHGLDHLASRLRSVQHALQYVPRNSLRQLDEEGASGKVVFLEAFRKQFKHDLQGGFRFVKNKLQVFSVTKHIHI